MGVQASCCHSPATEEVRGEVVAEKNANACPPQPGLDLKIDVLRPKAETTASSSTRAESPREGAASSASSMDLLPEVAASQRDVCEPVAAENEVGPVEKSDDEIVDDAIRAADAYMADLFLDDADQVLFQALDELDRRRGTEAAKAAAGRLRSSAVHDRVRRYLARYDETRKMLDNDGFALIWEKDGSSLELKMDAGFKSFDYRLTIDIPQTLTQVMSQTEETDLAHKAQPMLVEPMRLFGSPSPWLKSYMLKMHVAIFHVELVQESFRYRSVRDGYVLEGITSEFDQAGASIPEKTGWRTVRPRTRVANLYQPSEKGGTRMTQVSRVDVGFAVPQRVINFALWTMGGNFVDGIKKASRKAAEVGSPWEERIKADPTGFYEEIRKLEKAHEGACKPWDRSVLKKSWRLEPAVLLQRSSSG
eukprot:TRINITY_DN74626_c0_g1_i1.p1 TRINITY_DN74626_c0_g1~~TRINITY_DN74626_c0_g1_i1.p1  ORF type:complete len:420 (-),score=90.11 TRINITY_DN74626_c0_g1_i1:234-1493(-)